MVHEAIIIGGGKSIQEGIDSDLKFHLKDKFVILTNYAFKHFDGTILTFVDSNFYHPKNQDNPNFYEDLKSLPLIVGLDNCGEVKQYIHSNTILLKKSATYNREKSLEKGFYSEILVGVFALTLASFLMKYEGVIYLLGYDWTVRNKTEVDPLKYNPASNEQTHYYQNTIKHRGIGYVGFYENHDPHHYYQYFINEPKLKIYNVSLDSNIENFNKISYKEFYKLLDQEQYNQKELRKKIQIKLS